MSIYNELKIKNKFIYKKYGFNLGREEFEFLYVGENIRTKDALYYADLLINNLDDLYNNEYNNDAGYMNKLPVIKFYNHFMTRLKTLVKEEIKEKEQLEKITEKFIFHSDDEYLVKIGLVLAEDYLKEDKLDDVIDVFTKSSEYIFYLTSTIKKRDKYNTFLLNLAQKSDGFIKFFAITNMDNITEETNNYLIKDGYKNSEIEGLSILYIIDVIRIDKVIIDESIGDLSYLIYKCIRDFYDTIEIDIEEILDYYIVQALKNTESQYTIITLFLIYNNFIEDYESKYYDTVSEYEEEILEILNSKYNDGTFEEIIAKGLLSAEDVIDLAKFYNYNLTFNDLKVYYEKDFRDMNIYFYAKEEFDYDDRIRLLEAFKEIFDLEYLIEEQLDVSRDEVSEEFIDDMLFNLVIQSISGIKDVAKNMALIGIFGRINDVRKSSIRILKSYKESLTEEDKEIIYKAIKLEPNYKLKSELESICVDRLMVEEHVKDIYLMSTNVAGVQYRNRKDVEYELQNSKILYLDLEEDNPYDSRAIRIVGNDGIMIGYIPRRENFILSNLLKNGKYLYCKVREYDLDRNYIRIRVYLSYIDVLKEIKENERLHTLEVSKILN